MRTSLSESVPSDKITIPIQGFDLNFSHHHHQLFMKYINHLLTESNPKYQFKYRLRPVITGKYLSEETP